MILLPYCCSILPKLLLFISVIVQSVQLPSLMILPNSNLSEEKDEIPTHVSRVIDCLKSLKIYEFSKLIHVQPNYYDLTLEERMYVTINYKSLQ